MYVQQNPPRSPFTKGEGDLFVRKIVPCAPPFPERGVGGDFNQRQGFHLTTNVDISIAPYGGAHISGWQDPQSHRLCRWLLYFHSYILKTEH